MKPKNDNPLNYNIHDEHLSVRAQKGIDYYRIRTVGELTRLRPKDLLRLKNFGPESLKEVREMLNRYGLKLKE